MDFSSKGRSQFIQQLEEFIAETEKWEKEDVVLSEEGQQQKEIAAAVVAGAVEEEEEEIPSFGPDLSENIIEQQDKLPEAQDKKKIEKQSVKTEEIENVMNSGMQFLAGLFKMSTGKDMGIENQKIEVNRETGEVIMKFKLPI